MNKLNNYWYLANSNLETYLQTGLISFREKAKENYFVYKRNKGKKVNNIIEEWLQVDNVTYNY